MRIGELAERAGLSRDAVRFYEKVGLLKGRRLANGYRDFPPETVEWLRYVRVAQALGFSLAEIAAHGATLRAAEDPAETLSALLRAKLAVIDARLAELGALRGELAARIGQPCPFAPAVLTGPDLL
ncbi:MerR family transcriptional regulator [Cupriavidus malaysiensis]|uniref:MerR family transcriptional regulator n=1 Tax=Cupriavidus malaysiensis TaxID=367825 RepID=A0ABM6FDK4_9BURK|nr:MerR family transcriptional regulator [Cupriavidus malaysiensis]AOZ09879.1 MerR family transcriptional regulator [Cupriavidus malaysiensis]